MWGLGCGVRGLEFEVLNLEFGVWGSGVWVEGEGGDLARDGREELVHVLWEEEGVGWSGHSPHFTQIALHKHSSHFTQIA